MIVSNADNGTLLQNITTSTFTRNNTAYLPSWNDSATSNKEELSIIHYIELMILACLLFCIVVGNIFVIMSFVRAGRSMRTVTNVFVVNLAISDILVGCFSVPIWMLIEIRMFLISPCQQNRKKLHFVIL